MLRDEGVVMESSWAGVASAPRCEAEGGVQGNANRESHRDIDRELRRIANRRAALDAEEARWLREADRHRIWRKLGFATVLEYLEDVFGHAPRTAKERLRVATALGELPALEAELRTGKLPYSAVKELTRVVTPATEAQWLACARGRNVRDIEVLVAGHKKGDLPSDPKDPALMTRDVVFRLDARRQALLQQARAMFETERGESIDNAALIEALCISALQHGDSAVRGGDVGRDANDGSRGTAPPPAHQVVVRTCDDCSRAWMPARGALIEITRGDRQAMECDAEIVREADIEAAQAAGKRRPAPTLTIPQKTRDLVWARDEGRCQFPGCRAARHLAIHHIWFREHGGSHDAWNLLLLCDGHHKALHDGLITITGRAPDQLEFTRDGKRLVAPRSPASMLAASELQRFASTAVRPTSRPTGRVPTRFEDVVKLEHATQALRQLGYKTRAAKRALEEARAHVGTDADVPALVKAVLDLGRGRDARFSIARAEPETDVSKLARQALVQSGFGAAIADAAVARACARVGTDVELAALIKEALRYCSD